MERYSPSDFYEKCKQHCMTDNMKNYVIEFIKLFKTDINWAAIKYFQCIY